MEGSVINPQLSIKSIVILFILFLLLISDVFVDNIIAQFGDRALTGRTPTNYGIVLQGIFLSLFYIIAMYLIENSIL